jgi:hypothetical protein
MFIRQDKVSNLQDCDDTDNHHNYVKEDVCGGINGESLTHFGMTVAGVLQQVK